MILLTYFLVGLVFLGKCLLFVLGVAWLFSIFFSSWAYCGIIAVPRSDDSGLHHLWYWCHVIAWITSLGAIISL